MVRTPDGHAPDAAQMHNSVMSHARWPEAHLALEPGLHYHRSAEGPLAYQIRGGTAFAIGGLNSSNVPRLLQSFRRQTEALGIRRQLVFPVRSHELSAVGAAGFEALQVGVEAWIDLEGFTVRGNRFEGVRHMRNRACRHGVTSVEVAQPAGRADEFIALHTAWLRSKRPTWRMRLLVGSPGLEAPFDRRYFAAERDGQLQAFCTVLPGASGQWGVDVMCRRPDAASGAMEHLLLHVSATLRGEGARTLSLGACPMAEVPLLGSRRGLRRIFRGLYASRLGNQVFGFRNLVKFKNKFRPRYEPIHVAASPRLGAIELYLGCRMWGLY